MDTDAFATSLLSNLRCLLPLDLICTTEPSPPTSAPVLATPICPSPARITPSPQRTLLANALMNPTYLPTPSPTPSIHELKPILTSSPSLVSLRDHSPPPPNSRLPLASVTPTVPITAVHSFDAHLASPPPSSSPLRSRSHSRQRPIKIRSPTPEESIAEDSSSDETSDEDDCSTSQDERVFTEKESRTLIYDLLREAQGIWNDSQARRK